MSKKQTEEVNFNLRGGYGGYYLFQEQRGRGKLPFLGSNVIDPRLKHYKLHELSHFFSNLVQFPTIIQFFMLIPNMQLFFKI